MNLKKFEWKIKHTLKMKLQRFLLSVSDCSPRWGSGSFLNSVCFFVKQKRLPFSEALISAPRRSKCIFRQCSYLNLPLFELAYNLIYYYNTLSYQICQMFLFFCVKKRAWISVISKIELMHKNINSYIHKKLSEKIPTVSVWKAISKRRISYG